MRFYLITTLSILTFVSHAQDSLSSKQGREMPRQLIKISPFQFFAQTFEMSLETLSPNYTKSFQISAGYRSGHINFSQGKGATATLAFRKYARPMNHIVKNRPDVKQGIYYSLYLKGDYFKGTEENYSQQQPISSSVTKIFSVSPGFILGVQRSLFEVLYLDFYVGGGIKFPTVHYTAYNIDYQYDNDIFSPGYEGIYPMIGIKVGIGL